MVKVQILRWQEIPSLVEARDDSDVKKIQLSDKFQALIDEAAMRRELAGTDAYLEEWNKSDVEEHDGDVADVAERVANGLEERFSEIRDDRDPLDTIQCTAHRQAMPPELRASQFQGVEAQGHAKTASPSHVKAICCSHVHVGC